MLALKLSPASRAIRKNLLSTARAISKGAVRGLNRAAVKNRNDGSRIIRQTLNVRAAFVKSQMTVIKASLDNPRALVQAKYSPIPVIKFNGVRQTRRGVSVTMRKDKPRKVFLSAFKQKMPAKNEELDGHIGVFWRSGQKRRMKKGRYKGKVRQPIVQIYGPSVFAIFGDKIPEIVKVGDTYIGRFIATEIESQLKRRF